jgi:hypothetical protein
MDLQKVSIKAVKTSSFTYFSERLTCLLTNRGKIIFRTLMCSSGTAEQKDEGRRRRSSRKISRYLATSTKEIHLR